MFAYHVIYIMLMLLVRFIAGLIFTISGGIRVVFIVSIVVDDVLLLYRTVCILGIAVSTDESYHNNLVYYLSSQHYYNLLLMFTPPSPVGQTSGRCITHACKDDCHP